MSINKTFKQVRVVCSFVWYQNYCYQHWISRSLYEHLYESLYQHICRTSLRTPFTNTLRSARHDISAQRARRCVLKGSYMKVFVNMFVKGFVKVFLMVFLMVFVKVFVKDGPCTGRVTVSQISS